MSPHGVSAPSRLDYSQIFRDIERWGEGSHQQGEKAVEALGPDEEAVRADDGVVRGQAEAVRVEDNWTPGDKHHHLMETDDQHEVRMI